MIPEDDFKQLHMDLETKEQCVSTWVVFQSQAPKRIKPSQFLIVQFAYNYLIPSFT